MAAKQGLSAHFSQASEDAKRAVLARTTLTTSSWFSNLNTVCTIKSAPPKTPDVLQLLATKSGWLYKRNEQHVWQARWCCVVPHTFLYYFDATPVGAGTANAAATSNAAMAANPEDAAYSSSSMIQLPHPPTAAQQEEWNRAVQHGYHGRHRKQPEKRSNFYLFSSNNNNTNGDKETSTCVAAPANKEMSTDATMANTSGHSTSPEPYDNHHNNHDSDDHFQHPSSFLSPDAASKYTSLQPAGIIDLECYTRVHRSTTNPLVLELAGDDQVNPDLRQFYFSANGTDDAEDWSDALLNQRHSALVDECDAYKQVCDGFAQQLQQLHVDLDTAKRIQDESQEELYRVRSQLELDRRNCWSILQETCDQQQHGGGSGSSGMAALRDEFRSHLDHARRQDLGIATAVQLLRDYSTSVVLKCTEVHERNQQLEAQLQQSGQSDQQKVSVVQEQLEALQALYDADKQSWEAQLESMSTKQSLAEKELQDVQKELSSTRMEMTMYQTQQKNKTSLLQEHKRILKKEVIDLRTKLDGALAEVSSLKHEKTSHTVVAQQEREKNKLLERYVEKIESQVKVQQNMMEIMSSHSAACSVYGGDRSVDFNPNGGGGGSVRGSLPPVDFTRNVVVLHDKDRSTAHEAKELNDALEDDDDDEVDDLDNEDGHGGGLNTLVPMTSPPSGRRLFTLEDDAKSHMSELTEDRTQRHFDNYREAFSPYQDPSPRPSYRKQHQATYSPHSRPPPYVIGGSPPLGRDMRRRNQVSAKKNTKSSSSNSLPPGPSSSRRLQLPRDTDDSNQDAMSTSSGQRLSIAQKARLEADERSTSVPVWIDETVEANLKKKKNRFGFGGGGKGSNIKDQSLKDSNSSEGSGLWRHVEDAILGPRPEDMLSDSGSVSEESSGSTTNSPGEPVADSNRSPAKSASDKTKDTDSQSSMCMSIQERAQLQRAKQLQFLQQQGLISSERDVPRGAGGV